MLGAPNPGVRQLAPKVASRLRVVTADEAPIEVRDAQARLLFRYDPQTGQTVVGVPTGDLVLDLPDGAFRVAASRGIELRAPTFGLDAESARLRLGKLETVVGRLIERARNVYRRVDELAELRAGRVRTLAQGLLQLAGATAALTAKGVVRVDGQKIELG